jgi:hypothetical protein
MYKLCVSWMGIPPDHMQSSTSGSRMHSSWSLSSRGQWNGKWQPGITSMNEVFATASI